VEIQNNKHRASVAGKEPEQYKRNERRKQKNEAEKIEKQNDKKKGS
jgi:hypothetical protein